MKYKSTLGGCAGLTFRQALFSPGFMTDGGLLLPETIPQIQDKLELWSQLTYPKIVFEISKLFISEEEIPTSDLEKLINEALSSFSKEEILPVKNLGNGMKILEMFHGRTWAFKDLALSCVGRFVDYFMKKDGSRVIILVGTSGDTGSAVLEAVRDLDRVDSIVVLPRGRCTEIQERQMTTVIGENVHIYRVDGTSDDLDVPIINCFMDEEFSKRHNLICLNSINWARIMVQIAHHFFAYFRACEKVGDQVEVVIPTGAMGNLTSGLVAYKMGLPVRFVAAVTCNDVVDRSIKTGDVTINGDVIATLATAMNIANPYNMQRLVSLFSDNEEQVKTFMHELSQRDKSKIPSGTLKKIQNVISSFQGDDDVIKQTIKRCYHDDEYILCPHTALAVAYCYHSDERGGSGDHSNRICLATASPYKFGEAVTSSMVVLPENAQVKKLLDLPVKFTDLEKMANWQSEWTQTLREKIEQISNRN